MKNFSYTKSPNLIEEISKFDNLNRDLLLTPISPKDKLVLRWEATVDRIFYGITLSGDRSVSKEEIIEILAPKTNKTFKKDEKEIFNLKKVFDYIFFEWTLSANTITADILKSLYQTIYSAQTEQNLPDLEKSLRYIQTNPDHPLLQAALVQIIILTNSFFQNNSGLMSSLTYLLFLNKNGYDFRGMLVLDEYYFQNKARYQRLIVQAAREPNFTPWLEFVIEAAVAQLDRLLKKISTKEYQKNSVVINLNERQKNILGLLDQPGLKITNMTIQKVFKVSPITAARDLSKLTTLGLLLSIGKGRSTYYTKV